MPVELRPSLVASMGATGSGKSTGIHLALDADTGGRRLIWDLKGEYVRHGVECSTPAALASQLKKKWAGDFSLVFRPSWDADRARAELDWFCRVAYSLGDLLLVADELHMVLDARAKPPAWWRRVVSMGREPRLRVIAASQRPSDFDKNFWDQCTAVRSGRLNGEASARAVAGALLVDWREIVALPELHYIQRSVREPVIAWGRIGGTARRPREVTLSKKNIAPPAPAG